MIKRDLQQAVQQRLNTYPAVALLGPRQVGKTTLAFAIAENMASIYLDLESPQDRAKLSDPEVYLRNHENKLVILDEVQLFPGLFQCLRGLIDEGIRKGLRHQRFLLLGPASIELLKQSSESLAGRIAYTELSPIRCTEVPQTPIDTLWLRGGFPNSLLAPDDTSSYIWRQNFIKTYLERDIPQLGPRIPAETLRRFWTMLAHSQCTMLNNAQIAKSLGVDAKTIARYLDLMVDLLLAKRIPAWHGNSQKRLVKSPKLLLKDSGLCHALLNIQTLDNLLSHPIAGMSWEGMVIENILSCCEDQNQAYYYRTSGGAEIDLLIERPGNDKWAIEIKRNTAPKIEKGFYQACEDLKPTRKILVYPGDESYTSKHDIEITNLSSLLKELR